MAFTRGKTWRALPSEIYVSALLSLLVLPALIYLWPHPFQTLDAKIYDYKLRFGGPVRIDPRIVHVDVDDRAVQKFGLWPWDRELSGRIVTRLSELGAAAIVFDIFFPSPGKSSPGDRALFQSIEQSGRVVSATALGISLTPEGESLMEDDGKRDGLYLKREALYRKSWRLDIPGSVRFWWVNELRDSFVPLVPILEASKAVGHIKSTPDPDGVHRRAPLLVRFEDRCIPSLCLAALATYYDIGPDKVTVEEGNVLSVKHSDGTLKVPIDSHGNMIVNWPDRREGFPVYSVTKLFEEDPRIAGAFQGKIVVIAYSATGTTDMGINPLFTEFLLSRIHSCALNTLLTGQFVRSINPFPLVIPASGVVSLLFCFGCLGLRHRHGIALEVAIAAGFVVFAFVCMRYFSYEIPTSGPLLLFVVTATTLLVTRAISMESRADRVSHAMQRYLSPEMLESVVALNHEIDLSTRRIELTILFVDIKGFSTLSETMEVEYLQEFLNDFLEGMTVAVFDHHGTVDKFLGDGLLAFFGDPVELENHALAAIRAADRMHREMIKLNEKWSGAGIQELADGVEIRVGINTGIVVVGNIGSQRRMEYTVVGSAVNVASRLQEAAPAGGTLISARTFFLARDHIQATGPRTIKVKGVDRQIRVYEIDSTSGAGSRTGEAAEP